MQDIPKVVRVALLPSLFLRVEFADDAVRYWRSAINKTELDLLKKAGNLRKGLTQLKPEYYWLGTQATFGQDNTFAINRVIYDGNEIYKQGNRQPT
ncbi:hypothetical protein [Pediococcus acidilactici]|uniref:hypothetical protein n=1 Tax=Pediococcus acidilactici TaxID=1254 RepID=UPI001321EF5A|nr:hypothetical protein [Pediococcus acidilactici]KAF0387057.1 hypothetical protein GBO65_04810 [Pediococcus acidilactici]KAF0427496.1 hypothetical protein GBO85_06335 [Pediococcus acidilactici]KAF0443974.1 hypothetical protein GBO95_05580 [Pediococcus acidilactici]KAF0553211.1 hypothetical protein GBP46_04760 [Pediococcus acidilactici]MCT3040834.1 hypothetical protein [Pediococcus acidilactici]